MKVSIIIPIYNVEKYIEDCLESVYQQTYDNIEVILVNDCTPDSSMQIAHSIVSKYKHKYSTIIINHRHNMGLSEARNSGIKVAKGDYLYFIDSDDCIFPTTIDTMVNIANKEPDIEIIEGQYLTGAIIDCNKISNSAVSHKTFRGDKAKIQFFKEPTAWNLLLKHSFIQKYHINFIPGILHEDLLFRCSIISKLTYYATINAITYFYRMNPESITHTITPNHISSLMQILQVYEKSANENNSTLKKHIANKFCAYSFNYWSRLWREAQFHPNFYRAYSSIILLFFKRHFSSLNLYQMLLLSPSFFPYHIAKHYVKFIWKIRQLTHR